jgi:hypothetical protein
MQNRILYKEKFLEVEYNVLTDTVIANWRGEQSEETIMKGYEVILQKIKDHYAKALLDDHKDISGLWVGASEWIARQWFPRARQQGLKFIAFIFSEHKFSNMSTDKTLKLIDSPHVQGFHLKIAAKKWLEDMLRIG